ncbi:MAG: 1-deoxy-D-xylulose-5-phosphate reductoisomerase [Candidatus Gracilibacteria bacterium]
MRTIAIFGSTGSIGQQTLDVLRKFPEDFRVVGLTGFKNAILLQKQKVEFSAPAYQGLNQKDELIAKADVIVNALPGFAGLGVSLAAVRAGKTLLSANKESLAIAGRYLREEAAKTGAQIFPLDSEASAIWQLLHEYGTENLLSVTLTCSGGPFRGFTTEQLKNVTVEQALAHPTWKMGPKVSVDSATLVNKVLEIYEIHNLFDIPLKNISVVIHPQSFVHSMIHTKTGATKMHITQNDMRLFISYALHYPNQPVCPWPITRARKSELTFDQPDSETFRPLKWYFLHRGNPNFPIVLNALNDIAVQRFLAGEIPFLGIYEFIEAGLERFLWKVPPSTLEGLLNFHQEVSLKKIL